MLNKLQEALNERVLAISDGEVKGLQLSVPPQGKGDLAISVGPLASYLKTDPASAWSEIDSVLDDVTGIESVEFVGQFVNIHFAADALFQAASESIRDPTSLHVQSPQRIMVEYLSPNTNKPLHLGHLRNGVLGTSVAELLAAVGHTVIKSELINDRGEHICKSMLGYQHHGNGATPESRKMKGDHFVGEMYVHYSEDDRKWRNSVREAADQELRRMFSGDERVLSLLDRWNESEKASERQDALRQLLSLTADESGGKAYELLQQSSASDPDLQSMLKRWEEGDEEVLELWRTMNDWVYQGFDETNSRFGFTFDKVYLESELYTLGKDHVEEGLERGIFSQNESGDVYFQMPASFGKSPSGEPFRRKVLNGNGTSVYLTQDIGTAVLKAQEFDLDQSIYVVGDEQNDHFQALFEILKAFEYPWSGNCFHMSYGMVELPTGKMKSREGTVVDADDLADEMAGQAAEVIQAREPEVPKDEVSARAEVIAQAAIKFYLARAVRTAKMVFDPAKSLSFEGDSGPYCLYTYARAKSLLARGAEAGLVPAEGRPFGLIGNDDERACLYELMFFPQKVRAAAQNLAPHIVAEGLISLAAAFNRFYRNNRVVDEEPELACERLALVSLTAEALDRGLSLLGIKTLEKM
ncbi:MAG: arginine--tRNA ligase [Candidatus Paceibacterota bacterium]